MFIEDEQELLREENLRKFQTESSLTTRSVSKEENNSFEEDEKNEKNNKSGSTLFSEKVDRLQMNNIKQTSKREEKVLKKTEDTIKMAYTAFTYHDPSSFESAVFDLKSASSEISGLSLNKTETTISKTEQLQNNIENSRLHMGDTSPKSQIAQLHENIQNNILYMGHTSPQGETDFNHLKENEKEVLSISEEHSEIKSTDGCKEQVITGQGVFSIGKQFMNRLLKWSIVGYEMSRNNYELTSSNNHLHTLSKRLTK